MIAKIHFYNPVHFEPWYWRSPDTTGCGGSEASMIEMSRRLSARGHEVICYAPCEASDDNGVKWINFNLANFASPGLWIGYRCPELVDRLYGQRAWLVCQDIDYPHAFDDYRIGQFEKIIALCHQQADYLSTNYPSMAGKVVVSSNGIDPDKCTLTGIVRDQKKIVFASSPDRGLAALLKIFRLARERDPALSLTVCYGWQNMDRIAAISPKQFGDMKSWCIREMKELGVTFRGRISHPELIREWHSAGMFVYCTDFWESSCISLMEAQACGVVPIVSPLWAIGENLLGGVAIYGDPKEQSTIESFTKSVCTMATGMTDWRREEIALDAKVKFDLENIVEQWEEIAYADSLAIKE